MNKLGFLLSKKLLAILSGLIFTGVAFASSGAQSLLQNTTAASETKIPEVQKVVDEQQTIPSQQTPAKSSSTLIPTPKPIVTTSIPIASATPNETAKADDSVDSEINHAFQQVKYGD